MKTKWKPDAEKEIGRIKEDFRDIIIRKLTSDNKEFLDIRTWVKTEKYNGFSPKGIMLDISKKDKLIELLKKI